MDMMNRRGFLAGVGLAVGAATLGQRFSPAAENKPAVRRGTDVVVLGRSGIKTSVLGIGTGTVGGSQQLAMGQEGFTRLVRHALERGIRYIDTADMYQMHTFVRLALQGVPRDKYFIQTKTMARHPEVAKADIERFRRELRVETLDCVLMHCMTTGTWPQDMRPVMDVLQQAKQRGRIRAVGVSCHGLEPLAASVDCDWIDVQLARINPFGEKMDGKPEEVAPLLQQMHAKGRGMLGMKIYGENGLGDRQRRLQSLRYVLHLGSIDAFTIGFRSIAELDETLELIEQALVG